MSARISIRQADRSDIAKLRWTHNANRDAWVISSPLGNEVARIESDGAGATLTQAAGGGYQADSFADLTERILGVPLDPATLAAWVHGDLRDAPKDWRVTIDEKQHAGAVDLARRITAARGDVVVRLVVDDYQPLQE
jgi:outer membrane biogenesis lipoprotein LolB